MTDYLLPTGARVGKYEIVEHIASGGMAEVYRAYDPDLGRTVALKVLPETTADNPVIVERFRREALAAAKLSHKNIVAVYESRVEDGMHFLAMEYVEGTDLHNYICEKGRLDPKEAWVIVVQATRALDHACRRGITHRDVKPSNLLLSFRSDNKVLVKLTDFGLARAVRPDAFRVTRDGTTVGTIDYMAPEQARDSNLADVRSDIYSLGCTLYHMLAGQAPFPEGGLGERVYQHQHAEVPDVRLFNRTVPATLWAMLKKMLEKDPTDRYQSPDELLQAFLSLHSDPPSEPPHKLAPLPPRPVSSTVAATEPTPMPRAARRAASTVVPAAATVEISAEHRQAAAGQFERAKQVLATDNQDLAYAHQLLASCCRLDPANLAYRKTLRQVSHAVYAQSRIRRWFPSFGVWKTKAKLLAAKTARDPRKVLEHGEELLARAPEDAPTQFDLVDAAQSLGLVDTAIWMLEQLCKQDPENADWLRKLGKAYEKHDETAKALAVWNGVLKLVPYDLEASRKIDKLSVHNTIRRGSLGR